MVQDVLAQAEFNFPKMHLLSHYSSQIKDFENLPQYFMEITEALHKPLKDAYRRSNWVEAAEQILDTITRDHALHMRELNIQGWSRDFQLKKSILDLVGSGVDLQQPARNSKGALAWSRDPDCPILQNKQAAEDQEGTLMNELASKLMIPQLPGRFYEYLKLSKRLSAAPVHPLQIGQFLTHYYHGLPIPLPEFQDDGIVKHYAWWTAGEPFWKIGQPRADWV